MMLSVLSGQPLVLQVTYLTLEGEAKTNVLGATVRVFHWGTGVEVQDLAPTALSPLGSTSTWRYVWENPGLPAGPYVAEYSAIDADGLIGHDAEDIVIRDPVAEAAPISQDLGTLLDIGLGRQQVETSANLYRIHRRDGSVLREFDIRGSDGQPASIDICERVPR